MATSVSVTPDSTVSLDRLPLIISPHVLEKIDAYNADKKNKPVDLEWVVDHIVNNFRLRQAAYSGRDTEIYWRRRWFDGEHWASRADVEEDSSKLVFNYVRSVVLRYAAILARAPRPRVPAPADPNDAVNKARANNRERFLLSIWSELKRAWRDVELNASKCGFGVLQVVWEPPEPTMVPMKGPAGSAGSRKVYDECPFNFREIKPENFYPVYKTFKKADDFLWVFHHDPSRLIEDLEYRYNIILQGSGLAASEEEGETQTLGTQPTCEVVAYWDDKTYALVAITRVFKAINDARGRTTDVRELEKYALLEWDPNHGFGRVPFWVLQNIRNPNYDPTEKGSLSDIDDIVDLNKHYNWIVSEEADEIAVHIHRPFFYKSDDWQQDVNSLVFEPGAVNPIGSDEDIDTIEWAPQPGFVDAHLDRTVGAIKELSFLSDVGFGNSSGETSGVAGKIALAPMEQIVELKIPQRVDLLESVCKHLLKMFVKFAGDVAFQGFVLDRTSRFGEISVTPEDIAGNYFVQVQFGNLIPRDDEQHEQNETYKFKTGAQSLYDTLDRMGEEDPDAAIARIKKELMDPELNPGHVLEAIQAKQSVAAFAKQQQLERAQQQTQGAGGGSAGMDSLSRVLGGGQGAAPPGGGRPGIGMGSPAMGMPPGGQQPPQPGMPGGGEMPPAGPPMNAAPPVPSNAAFPRRGGGAGGQGAEMGMGAGRLTPFLGRSRGPNPPRRRPGIREEG